MAFAASSLWPGGGFERYLAAHEKVLLHFPIFYSVDEHIGCLPLNEILG
jgi:hypothetical protein